MTIKYYTILKQINTVTYELQAYSLKNYTDANTISLYDSKIVVKEYEIAASVAACEKNLERLSTTNFRRLDIPVIWRMISTLLPKDIENILVTAVFIQLFRLLMSQARGTKTLHTKNR